MSAVTAIDPFATQFLEDPHVAYDEIRRDGDVVWCEPRQCWLIVGFAAARTAFRDTDVFTSREGIGEKRHVPVRRRSILTIDPPEHGPARDAVGRSFVAATLRALEPFIESECDRLLALAMRRPEFDVVAEYASQLPTSVIGALLGLEPDEVEALRPHVFDVTTTVDVVETAEARHRPIEETYARVDAVFRAALERPPSDLTSPAMRGLQAAADAGDLPFDEVLGFCSLLFAAGTHTTGNLIGSAVLLLLEHGLLATMAGDGADEISAIEEVLRLEPPIQAVFRSTTQDVELGDAQIAAGERVAIVMAAANRDPAKFADPHDFVAGRVPNPHLAFAYGAHHCLGAALARLEARIALQRLAQHAPALRPAQPGPPARDALRLFRGPARLLVSGYPL